LSYPIILTFMRKATTLHYLLGKFKQIPHKQIIQIQNVDDATYNIKKMYQKPFWLSNKTIFTVACLLTAFGFFYHSWIAATLVGFGFILVNLLWMCYEKFGKRRDPLIQKYKNLVMRGETLLIIQCEQLHFDKFIKSIQKVQDEPITFFSFTDEKLQVEIRSKEMLPHAPETYEELEKQAKGLSKSNFTVSYQKKYSQSFLKHVNDLSKNYQTTYKQLNNFASYNENIQLSAEWLLDNSYTVKQSLQDVQKNLPEVFFSELPFISAGPYVGAPALYPLVSRIIAASDGRITAENITLFLNAYQENKRLTMGELWAFPLILKIRLIECLVNLTTKILNRVKENQAADFWANRILNASRIDSEKLYVVLSNLSKEMPHPTSYFADQLMIQLTDTEAANTVIFGWLQRKVGENLHDIIQVEQAKQTLDQTSIANVISSLRRLEQINWREIFNEVSVIEKILCTDPAQKYAQMDFQTKDKYRHAVEKFAKLKKISEESVANDAIALASHESSPLTSHVGYYLLDKGKAALEQTINYQPTPSQNFYLACKKHRSALYLSACLLYTIAFAFLFSYFFPFNPLSWPMSIGMFILSLIPFSEIAIQLINSTIVRFIPPNLLPKMNYKEGVPENYRTLIVIPTLLSSVKSIQNQLEKLEIHYLANTDPQIAFGIVSDFTDNPEENHHEDSVLLKQAEEGIEYLNLKYPENKFYLFHRNRKFNEQENYWMGWERKRGKLENLNCFLCGSEEVNLDNFLHKGDSSYLSSIAYVLTVDSDTQIPKDSVKRLIETLSHPLNVGYLDPVRKELIRGYTIIQPRVSTNYLCANSTWFSKLFSDPSGVDPYAKSISDVYQDVFDEGVYHGKGLYDYKKFHDILSNRLPENKILSHDLLEGAYVRTAFASDIEFYDSFPETYALYVKRQQRWVRGDWQLLNWLGYSVLNNKNDWQQNPLSVLNRWKIFDNLRRSVLPIASLAIFLISWFTSSFLPWTLLVAFVMTIPIALRFLDFSWIPSTIKFAGFFQENYKNLIKALLSFSFLPHQAWINASAIFQALYRQYISKKNLLQWSISDTVSNKDHLQCLIQLGVISGLSFLLIVFFILFPYPGIRLEIPIAILWLMSPLTCHFLNKPYREDVPSELSRSLENYIRLIARKTWRYFDDFVNTDTHFLPPDNYQEKLKVEIAYRTSPTNIGLYMMSAISAQKLGYISVTALVQRLSETIISLNALERYEGHFLNWYDIKNIAPLMPKYVSTVDSGNLLASFWAVEEKCKAIFNEPILNAESVIAAINDNLNILENTVRKSQSKKTAINMDPLYYMAKSFRAKPAEFKSDVHDFQDFIKRYLVTAEAAGEPQEVLYWLRQQEKLISDVLDCLGNTMPWIKLFQQPAAKRIILMHPEGTHWKENAMREFPTFQNLLSRNIEGLIPFIGWLQSFPPNKLDPELDTWAQEFIEQVNQSFSYAEKFYEATDFLMKELHEISAEMNLSFLYNEERKLFSIGYNVSEHKLDSSCYDLLASEARLASFIAIAKGDVPLEHWWTLGRPTTEAFGTIVVQSWGGTMFEYLMPMIWCKNFSNTLLDYACKTAVKCQIAYGKQLGIPWGISESAYSRLDIHNIYQYRAFGVPLLGLKTGLDNDFVITPYSSALALMIDPEAAVANLKRLNEKAEMRGPYGFFEAIDYSSEYNPDGRQGIIIHTYMAHHLGMSISSICNLLHKSYLQELFHAHPRVKSLESILYERPQISEGKVPGRSKEQVFPKLALNAGSAGNSRFESPLTPVPVSHLLSNGNYSIMLTNSGSGYSKYQNLDITRWRVDATCDNWGCGFFVKDVERNLFFSTASYPTANLGSSYAVNFSNHKVEITKKDQGIEAFTEIVVSPEDNVEIRCITLTNQAMRYRLLEVTSYIEIALADHKADLIHPAFSKMFIQTEAVVDCEGLIAHRRKRSDVDREVWCFHIAALDTPSLLPFSYETRRDLFIGQNKSLENPEMLSGALSNTQGYVLDPMFSLRKKIRIEAGKKAKISFITGFAHTREEALRLMNKYKNIDASKRVMEMAWTHAELDLRRLHITHDEAHLFQRLANFMIYPDKQLRASSEILKANRFGQNKLWAYGISGDNPIMLVVIEDLFNSDVVNSALQAHAFWNLRGLKADIVILNKEKTSYDKPLNDHLIRMAQVFAQYTGLNTNGGIFILESDKIPNEDLTLIYTVAHAVLVAEKGNLSQLLAMPRYLPASQPLLKINSQDVEEPSPSLPFLELLFYNGLGGFTQDGKEYAIFYEHDKTNLAPWVNVICNKNFGFLTSAHGLGMTWHHNSQTNRLTPWSNDATLNPITDVCYVRDDENGKFWTITAAPIFENDAYRAMHGNGYSTYEHNSHAIEQVMTIFVPLDEEHSPVRIQILKLTNRSSRTRKLSVFNYVELVLSQEREESQRYIETSWNYENRILMATNYYRTSFGNNTAFLSCTPMPLSYTGNRKEFIGRNQHLSSPDALKRSKLSERTGVAMDPCFALQTTIELYPNESSEIVIVLGECSDPAKAKELCNRYLNAEKAHTALDQVKNWWDELFNKVQIKTPESSLNLIFNRWLTYQNLSCRMWGRSAFYQSGGAYGFRDQLQDVAGLVYLDPAITRAHILKSASRQFIEGDVQHWWHAETGSGVRTKISDDLLWLPYVVLHYIQVTGDHSIMNEEVNYIEGRLLNEEEHEAIVIPTISETKGTIKEHCLKAIERSMTFGPHGLPLIGGGDWNDGMNLVGTKGKGESVWLAWFIIYILKEFSCWFKVNQEYHAAEKLTNQANNLLKAIEDKAWDGAWYLRAFFDDGTPIGSHANIEDKIDSLPQSWAVINGQDNERVKSAMDSVEKYLIDEVNRLILLFTPPFEKTGENPGYIRGYPPGVRENGGQYTHAAVWVAMAFAKRGEGDKAMHLLQMINPINRTKTLEEVYKYRVEPYVTAADIYALPQQEGRGGWTWYTGSASLMYRTILEDVMGFMLNGEILRLNPCIPSSWDQFTLTYRHGEACYEIYVHNPHHVCKGVSHMELDGQTLSDFKIPLVRTLGKHEIKVFLGRVIN